MKRYHCSICNKKRNQSELIKISSDLHKKAVWSCKEHTSNFSDVSHIRTSEEKPVFLEFFSGSKHISNYAESLGFEVISIDFEEKFNPTICSDIQKIKSNQLPKNVFAVWASIPCTTLSTQNLINHWQKIELGYRNFFYVPKTKRAIETLRIINKTLRLIAEINPIYYFIENPRGALRHFPHLKIIPYRKTVSYSDYGFNVYKPTDIFTNCKNFNPIQIKKEKGKIFESKISDLNNAFERSLIPIQLIEEVFNSILVKK